MADARFKIRGNDRIYAMAALDEVSLKDMLTLRGELDDLGISTTWGDITAAAVEIGTMSDADADPERHPLYLLVFAVTLWAARRASGEAVTFGEAIDVPVTAIEFLPVPDDRRPAGKAKGPKKGRKGSGAAADRLLAEAAASESSTSTD